MDDDDYNYKNNQEKDEESDETVFHNLLHESSSCVIGHLHSSNV